MTLPRRRVLAAGLAAWSAAAVSAPAVRSASRPIGRVVVVGGGFGGATAAKYLKMWEPRIDVTLVERRPQFVSCPMSNLVLAGFRQMADITRPYDGLARYGVRRVTDEATAIDVDRRQVRLARGAPLSYDRLILAPGIDFQLEKIRGLADADRAGRLLHAWTAGPQTQELRARLRTMRDGGVFAIVVPKGPYRCPPGPYERASVVAQYFKKHKPRNKVLVLDANPELVSKKDLFLAVWREQFPLSIEYRPNAELLVYDHTRNLAHFKDGPVKADLFNIIPPQQAGRVANPLINVNEQWILVEFKGWEAVDSPGVHVIGDAIAPAPGMPKSALMANNHAKVVADAVIARLTGQPVSDEPIIANTCYSFVDDTRAVHVASVHKWNAEKNMLLPVPGAGGLSTAPSELEGVYATYWAQNILHDTLT